MHSEARSRLPETVYYYPEPFWGIREGNWIKTLLLFFDGIAILLPRYMYGRHAAADRTLVEPLEDRGLLRILEPETFIDQDLTEALAEAVVGLLTAGAFDDLDPAPYYTELSQSRMGWNADVELSTMLIDELKTRNLARDSEDGVSVPLHPTVRTTILVILSQLARAAGRRQGLDLHPATNQSDVIGRVIETLQFKSMPSAGRVVAFDVETVTLNLDDVPLDDVLAYRAEHGEEHRAYARNVRHFLAELSLMQAIKRESALLDRREELADEADRLRRLARKSWHRPLARFGLGAAGAAWSLTEGNIPGALLSLGGGILGALPDKFHSSAYSYLFNAERSLSR